MQMIVTFSARGPAIVDFGPYHHTIRLFPKPVVWGDGLFDPNEGYPIPKNWLFLGRRPCA